MRGNQDFQGAMFSYISLEERVPQTHPLRKLRAAVDALLATMNREFDAVYARRGRPSVPPEMLLKALLLQILFSIRSERQLVEAVNYNLLYRWFVGLNIEDKVWDHSTFSANRERLFNEDLARAFFERVKHTADWAKLTSDEHFSVDGTLIEAWASHKSFKRRDDDQTPTEGRNPEVDFKGQQRCNDTHASTTDPDARLFKKSAGDKARLCHMAHILMENRNGLIVDVEITHASGTAEREAALAMLGRRDNKNKRATVGADKGYDSKAFIKGCRKLKVTPHVAAKDKHSAVDARITRHEGYKTSQKVRKRIEEAFGWIKTVGGLAKTKLIGQAKLTGQALLCFATYNLVRMGSIGGWWDAHHA
ncbi:IS4 family transposase [Acidovorax temperans]|uniref:IS4 family transposase n=2 Tax=Acidovorax temperans TaxID=80878 RepID=A0A543LKL5_9BURK|nr:IS5 family transposase [Acidovorax temperans]TQN01250.1 IS4 family transposase [Acidovorax temperans]TQN07491.1 IS4 family transposase [Acidovorax temperans]TQN07523.1 IS4 family transposase [Acidovorax temperans]TQN07761.1 IS4 family transposase [Acidovorax temperans]TQN08003.1 IS4 family transposase [Acidovorax temperans]